MVLQQYCVRLHWRQALLLNLGQLAVTLRIAHRNFSGIDISMCTKSKINKKMLFVNKNTGMKNYDPMYDLFYVQKNRDCIEDQK